MDDLEIDLHSLRMNDKSIMIHVSLLGPALVSRVIQECCKSDSWHKFVIGNVETYDREFILKTIIDFVHPSDLLPLKFIKKKRAFFIARNCLDAILKIMSNQLVIPNPLHNGTPLRVVIIANHLSSKLVHVDLSENILIVLKRRLNVHTKTLDLNKFHADSALTEFCLLSQPKLMLYVMQYIAELQPVPAKLELKDNYIKLLDPISALASLKIRGLDLRNNELATMEDLEPLRVFENLEILKLDGNPLCNLYSAQEYVTRIKQICPKIQMIDGLNVFHPNGFLISKRNFLCSFSGGDLVNQFIQYYFTVYDYEDRSRIIDLYHNDAMFSVTGRLLADQRSYSTLQLNHFLAISRNLYSPTQCFNSKDKFLFMGRKSIRKVICGLPQTFHDPLQFQCDLIYYTEEQAVLVVHGVFREETRRLGFSRTFVLQCDNSNAYSITNDQLHIYNALNHQVKVSHKFPANVEVTCNPLPYYSNQFTELQQAVHNITDLNYEYSRRFLEICSFDLKSVLTNFMEMYVKDQIPPEAFIEPVIGPLRHPDDETKAPLPAIVEAKTKLQYGTVNPCTTWQLLNNERVAAASKKMSTAEILELLNNPSAASVPEPTFDMPDEILQTYNKQSATNDNQPGTSQDVAIVQNDVASPQEPVTEVINKLNKFKKQRKAALKKQKATLKQNILEIPQDPTYNPNEYLEFIKKPEELGIGRNEAVTEILVQSLAKCKGGPHPLPYKRKQNKRNKRRARKPNVNIIKQQYFFTT